MILAKRPRRHAEGGLAALFVEEATMPFVMGRTKKSRTPSCLHGTPAVHVVRVTDVRVP